MAVLAPMPVCKTCHRVYLEEVSKHACPPQFRVWDPDQGETLEDADIVYAEDADTAVEMWAEQDDQDSAEYSIAKGTAAVVCVQRYSIDNKPESVVERYRVEGYYNPVYLAELVR